MPAGRRAGFFTDMRRKALCFSYGDIRWGYKTRCGLLRRTEIEYFTGALEKDNCSSPKNGNRIRRKKDGKSVCICQNVHIKYYVVFKLLKIR